jgi:hypothetical protein
MFGSPVMEKVHLPDDLKVHSTTVRKELRVHDVCNQRTHAQKLQ